MTYQLTLLKNKNKNREIYTTPLSRKHKMDTNTILIIVNMILTVIIAPLITIFENFIKRLSRSKCFGSEASLSRENTPPMLLKTDNMKEVEEIIKRLSRGKTQNIEV